MGYGVLKVLPKMGNICLISVKAGMGQRHLFCERERERRVTIFFSYAQEENGKLIVDVLRENYDELVLCLSL